MGEVIAKLEKVPNYVGHWPDQDGTVVLCINGPITLDEVLCALSIRVEDVGRVTKGGPSA